MTRSFLTVRAGATVTHVHCKDMAAMWITHLIAATSVRSQADEQLNNEESRKSRAQVNPENGKESHPDQHDEQDAIFEEP